MKKEIVNADGMVFGRLASIVAQKLLSGTNIEVYNIEKVLLTGNLEDILSKYRERLNYKAKGNPYKGPKYSKMPHLIFRKAVKNMLPHQKTRGREALHKLKVHIGMPSGLNGVSYNEAKLKKGLKYVTLGEVCKRLGARW